MKRMLAVLILLGLCISMTGCALLDYHKANTLYKEEQYTQAQALYQSLGDFADCADMARLCGQKADYAAATEYRAAGDYAQAAAIYDELGMYADSPLQAVLCRYEGGQACIAAGDYEEAIRLLEPLGGYENSADLANLARWYWLGMEPHTKVLEESADRCHGISVEPVQEGVLQILLEDKGLLLGLPYETKLTLTLERNVPEADYTLCYTTTNVSTITEIASGTAQLRAFSEGLPVGSFVRIVTDMEGNETISNDTADAIMMQAVMAEVVANITENLPVLLAESGVDITMTDLGF